MDNSQYLGTERVGKLLRQFAIPCICSLIISCLYNIVNQIFVNNGIGYLGNAATVFIFPITVVGWGLSLFFWGQRCRHAKRFAGTGRNKRDPSQHRQPAIRNGGHAHGGSHQHHWGHPRLCV